MTRGPWVHAQARKPGGAGTMAVEVRGPAARGLLVDGRCGHRDDEV